MKPKFRMQFLKIILKQVDWDLLSPDLIFFDDNNSLSSLVIASTSSSLPSKLAGMFRNNEILNPSLSRSATSGSEIAKREKARKKGVKINNPLIINDIQRIESAQDWIRTSTSLRTLRPEHSASTNFATWAGVLIIIQGCKYRLSWFTCQAKNGKSVV